MARKYKRDKKGRFAKTGASLKRRYQKGHKGAGAIHRRRRDQWNSGRKRDKAKVIAKTGFNTYSAGAHAISYARDRRRARSSGFVS